MTAAFYGHSTDHDVQESLYPLTWLRAIAVQQSKANTNWLPISWLTGVWTVTEGDGFKQISNTEFECVRPGLYNIQTTCNWSANVGVRICAPVIDGVRILGLSNYESASGTGGRDRKIHSFETMWLKGQVLVMETYQTSGVSLKLFEGTEINIYSHWYDPSRY
jgi:hypothetical protein